MIELHDGKGDVIQVIDLSDEEIAERLHALRIYMNRGGGVFCAVARAEDEHPLLVEIGCTHGTAYSLSGARSPGREGYADEREWRIPVDLWPIAAKVAAEQDEVRRLAREAEPEPTLEDVEEVAA